MLAVGDRGPREVVGITMVSPRSSRSGTIIPIYNHSSP
jgi:hypothetical protein